MSRFGKPEKTKEHRYFEERLSAYLDGELGPQEREAVQDHLSTCQACQWDLDTLSKTVQWTRELPTVPVPRVFTIPVPAAPQRAARRRWSFVPALQAATAVIALLLFFAVVGDFWVGGFRMAGAPERTLMEQQVPAAVEMTQVVDLTPEEPPAEAQAPRAIVVETVEVEVEQPVEVQAEKSLAQPTPAPLPTQAPEPASAEESGAASDRIMASEAATGWVEGESSADTLGMAATPSPAAELEVPAAAGGEAEALALTALASATRVIPSATPIPPTATPRPQPTNTPQLTNPPAPTNTPQSTNPPGGPGPGPVRDALRLIEGALGVLLVALAASTLVAMVQRRRSR